MLTVSGDLAGANVDGPDSWSPDGAWISGTERRSGARTSQWHEPSAQHARWPMSAPLFSPDGTRVSFILSTQDGWDLYVAKSDGTAPRRILEQARNLGWSPDGRYVLGALDARGSTGRTGRRLAGRVPFPRHRAVGLPRGRCV